MGRGSCVSIDLDPVPGLYDRCVPALLDLLDRAECRATFFVIGRDATRHGSRISEIAQRGHEIANHTMDHHPGFARLPAAEKLHQIQAPRPLLEDLAGHAVVGFRAPAWDVDEATLDILEASHYVYDSSVVPARGRRALGWAYRIRRPASPYRPFRRAYPRRTPVIPYHPGRPLWCVDSARSLWEVPTAVGRWRLPMWGTPLRGRGKGFTRAAAFLLASAPLPHLQLHGADVADAAGEALVATLLSALRRPICGIRDHLS